MLPPATSSSSLILQVSADGLKRAATPFLRPVLYMTS